MLCVPGEARLSINPLTLPSTTSVGIRECSRAEQRYRRSRSREAHSHSARVLRAVCDCARGIGRCEYPPKSLVELSMMSVMRVSMPLRAVRNKRAANTCACTAPIPLLLARE
jgi:hypothetical protein